MKAEITMESNHSSSSTSLWFRMLTPFLLLWMILSIAFYLVSVFCTDRIETIKKRKSTSELKVEIKVAFREGERESVFVAYCCHNPMAFSSGLERLLSSVVRVVVLARLTTSVHGLLLRFRRCWACSSIAGRVVKKHIFLSRRGEHSRKRLETRKKGRREGAAWGTLRLRLWRRVFG